MSSPVKDTCPYQITKLLGKGSYGSVYRAVGPTGKNVAVKKLHQFGLQDMMDVMALSRVNHPHVIKILDLLSDDVCLTSLELGIVMNLADTTATSFITMPDMLSRRAFTRLAWELCQTVSFLHANHILHLDIKPENILIRGSLDAPHPLIADFGISMIVRDAYKPTRNFNLKVSAPYRAPEVAPLTPDKPYYEYTGKVDVYALGLTLYQIAAKRGFGNHLLPFYVEEDPREIFTPEQEYNYHYLHLRDSKWEAGVGSTYGTRMLDLIKRMISEKEELRPTIHEVISSSIFENFHTPDAYVIDPPEVSGSGTVSFHIFKDHIDGKMSVGTYFHLMDIFYAISPQLTDMKVNNMYRFSSEFGRIEVGIEELFESLLAFAGLIASEMMYTYDAMISPFQILVMKTVSGHIYRNTLVDESSSPIELLALLCGGATMSRERYLKYRLDSREYVAKITLSGVDVSGIQDKYDYQMLPISKLLKLYREYKKLTPK